ncbi:hypothetical protein [Nostoc sp. CHAB 5715]|uniref:hypothetical protein n=1 Tax=Nostoc sp. CHAB 5715 TaxID=2780400 RepID=UPI001E3D5E61|nr:hypothetical protein [Nostoc sp. CHAB 5715]MCC5620567.1 hypothetical protein [Nostoc sp. CHAB 5715]
MDTLELLRFYVSAQKSLNQSTLIEAKLANAIDHDIKPHDGDIPFVAVFLAHISFMIVWGTFVFLVSYASKAVQDAAQDKHEIVSIKHLEQHPCKNCQFFNKNHYLKCAVQPFAALTKEALNCSDYKPK